MVGSESGDVVVAVTVSVVPGWYNVWTRNEPVSPGSMDPKLHWPVVGPVKKQEPPDMLRKPAIKVVDTSLTTTSSAGAEPTFVTVTRKKAYKSPPTSIVSTNTFSTATSATAMVVLVVVEVEVVEVDVLVEVDVDVVATDVVVLASFLHWPGGR